MDEKNEQKRAPKFQCILCNYICSKKYNYDRHIQTDKHKMIQTDTKNEQNEQNEQNTFSYCKCGKKYKYDQGLTKHKKKCTLLSSNTFFLDIVSQKKDKEDMNQPISTELIVELIKDNRELQQILVDQNKMIIELSKHNHIFSNNTTNINSNNKSFNLQFFLNETCKDAMNMMDFVESIQLQLSDLEKVGEIGYVNGISNIIVKKLKELDITKRPVHCTDKKREVMYIKDDNKWEKDDCDNKKMRKFIKKVANKNTRLLQKFKEVHPDCIHSDSHYSDQYNKIIVESMGGSGDNDTEKEDKIIRKIAKEVIIDK
jgi:hypothetical protein